MSDEVQVSTEAQNAKLESLGRWAPSALPRAPRNGSLLALRWIAGLLLAIGVVLFVVGFLITSTENILTTMPSIASAAWPAGGSRFELVGIGLGFTGMLALIATLAVQALRWTPPAE